MDREDIIKLARKAGFDPHDMSDDFTCNLVDIERFAELIVRECANRIDYWESRQGEHSDDLLKHFGVEE